MSEIMDLVVIEKKNAMAVFTNNDQLDPLIEAIEKEARSLVPDVTTKKGRDAIASMAHKVARSKTYIDNAGKDLVAELKALPKQIDESRRVKLTPQPPESAKRFWPKSEPNVNREKQLSVRSVKSRPLWKLNAAKHRKKPIASAARQNNANRPAWMRRSARPKKNRAAPLMLSIAAE